MTAQLTLETETPQERLWRLAVRCNELRAVTFLARSKQQQEAFVEARNSLHWALEEAGCA